MPFPSPGDLPDPGIEPESPALQADSLPSEPPGSPYVILTVVVWWFSRQVVSDSCDPMDSGLLGSSIHGILQARILEWVAIPFSRVSSQPRDITWVSCIGRQTLYRLSHQGGPKPVQSILGCIIFFTFYCL